MLSLVRLANDFVRGTKQSKAVDQVAHNDHDQQRDCIKILIWNIRHGAIFISILFVNQCVSTLSV